MVYWLLQSNLKYDRVTNAIRDDAGYLRTQQHELSGPQQWQRVHELKS
ncbi:hypothetical protein M595_2701 [Lyngbya aestuarii BL J]|uniref:Uncharacterized protein n=1 Tax=Lyngbya aestuarii BL J TaxID=1348334 RepID=U7QJQ2_9CYAN|nr:hypothetical protein [Lyngbya aestuarii]ERT07330.1 hypothetical protein M595_2701 [Lyngbya aestuarii BL J]